MEDIKLTTGDVATLDIRSSTSDIEFCEFYCQVIENLLRNIDRYVSWKRYLDAFRRETNSWCEFENAEDQRMLEKFMSSPYYRLTYIYKNSTFLSSAVAFHFQNIFHSNPTLLTKLLDKREIRICSLGGGPGSDSVALIKMLDDAAKEKDIQLDISVTVIDVDSEWEEACLSVFEHLKSTVKADLNVHFIRTDISKFYTPETVDSIQGADVVLMVKLLSEFVGSLYDFQYVTKVLCELVQPGSMLFILDRPKESFIRRCGGYSGVLAGFDLFYEETYDLHVLNIDAIAKAFYLYYEHIENRVFNTCLKIFVRAWLKTDSSEPPVASFALGRFSGNREKYDARRYLDDEIFLLLEDNFVDRISSIGMPRNSFESYVAEQRRLRDDLYADFVRTLRALDSVKQGVKDEITDTGSLSLESWKKFVKSKMDLSYLKRAIYCELVISFRGCLKWDESERSSAVPNWREAMVNDIPEF